MHATRFLFSLSMRSLVLTGPSWRTSKVRDRLSQDFLFVLSESNTAELMRQPETSFGAPPPPPLEL